MSLQIRNLDGLTIDGMILNPYIFLSCVSFLVNLPLGFIREKAQRFSPAWFFWIHASIPLIVYLRITLGTSKLFIPVSIGLAIYGQFLGARWCRRCMPIAEQEMQQRIGPLDRDFSNKVDPSQLFVVLMNMGGPRTNADVRDFQRRLFTDRRLIHFPLGFLLQRVFAWVLITLRGGEAEKRYRMIGGGSPIYASTEAQTQALRKELSRRGIDIPVTYSFNYSEPLPETTMQEVQKAGKTTILPLSLYPHYSAATTGSNLHYLKIAASRMAPKVTFLNSPSYYLHEGYIQAFVDRINESLKPGECLDDFYVLFSAHGLPLYFLKEADPYPFEIARTVAAVCGRLGRKDRWVMAYQSAVGPLQWLKPSTDDMLHALARRGIKKVLVVPISFVSDHIETTLEIDTEYRDMAIEWGVTDFRMSKAIEAHEGFIQALADSVEAYVQKSALINQTVS